MADPVSPDTAAAEPPELLPAEESRAVRLPNGRIAIRVWSHTQPWMTTDAPNAEGVQVRWLRDDEIPADAIELVPVPAAVPPATTAEPPAIRRKALRKRIEAGRRYWTGPEGATVSTGEIAGQVLTYLAEQGIAVVDDDWAAGSAVPAVPPDTECARLVRHWTPSADMEDSTPWRCRLHRDHYGGCSPHRAGFVEAVPDPPSAPDEPTSREEK